MTGRHENALDNSNPAAARLARLLRTLRKAAGSPSYRTMATIAHYSASALSLAANGKKVPTWDCTRAYLRSCGVTEELEVARWRKHWELAHALERNGDDLGALYPQTDALEDPTSVEIDVLVSAMGVLLPSTPRAPIETDLTGIKDLVEFRGALNQLKDALGLTLREIEKRSSILVIPDAVEGRKGRDQDTFSTTLARSVIFDMLTGKSSLIPRTVNIYLTACGLTQDEVGTWLKVLYRLRADETRVAAAKKRMQDHASESDVLVQALNEFTAPATGVTSADHDEPAVLAPSLGPASPGLPSPPAPLVSDQLQADIRAGRHRRRSTLNIWIRQLRRNPNTRRTD